MRLELHACNQPSHRHDDSRSQAPSAGGSALFDPVRHSSASQFFVPFSQAIEFRKLPAPPRHDVSSESHLTNGLDVEVEGRW